MSECWIVLAVIYYIYGFVVMFKFIQSFKQLTGLDVFGIALIFWLIGPVLAFFHFLDSIKIGSDK